MAKITLDDQFIFYSCYHNNPTNRWIHIVCVWPLLFFLLVMLAFTSSFYDATAFTSSLPFSECWQINWSFVLAAFYVVYYPILDRPVGLPASFLSFVCYIAANYVKVHELSIGGLSTFNAALAGVAVCGLAQLYGHAFYERRSPPVVDNLWQALSMVPLATLLEVFLLFGYRPEFKEKVDDAVKRSVAEWRASLAESKSKAT